MKIPIAKLFVFTGMLPLVLLPLLAMGNDAQMRVTLVKIQNRLQALKPLIILAQAEQDAHARTQFHFKDFVDYQGQKYTGLLTDVNHLQQGITHYLNEQPIDPRLIAPVKGDFIGGDHV